MYVRSVFPQIKISSEQMLVSIINQDCLSMAENKHLVSFRGFGLYSKLFLIAGSSRKLIQVDYK